MTTEIAAWITVGVFLAIAWRASVWFAEAHENMLKEDRER